MAPQRTQSLRARKLHMEYAALWVGENGERNGGRVLRARRREERAGGGAACGDGRQWENHIGAEIGC